MKSLEYKLLAASALLLFSLLIFSYCFVDLNLTLTRNSFFLGIIEKLQFFGYYKRGSVTVVYLVLISALYAIFALILILLYKKKLSKKFLGMLVLMSTILLIPSYPFLSHDLFNYIFDARIITTYNLSPYAYRPMDFPNDDWTRFMHWVHRYSPYGPLWLIYSVIPSLAGAGKFIVTFFSFKLFIGLFHLLNSLLIYKACKNITKNFALPATAFYALNPILLIEGVVNAHNDIVHAFFIIMSVFLLSKKNIFHAFITILLGSLIKYIATISFPPLLVFKLNKRIENYVYINLILYTVFTLIFSTFRISVPFVSSGSLQTQFQPWYLFWTIPLIAFVPANKMMIVLAILLSYSSSLRYAPYLLFGDWSHVGYMQVITIVVPLLIFILYLFKNNYEKIFK